MSKMRLFSIELNWKKYKYSIYKNTKLSTSRREQHNKRLTNVPDWAPLSPLCVCRNSEYIIGDAPYSWVSCRLMSRFSYMVDCMILSGIQMWIPFENVFCVYVCYSPLCYWQNWNGRGFSGGSFGGYPDILSF